ncbi:MAG: class I SAM-dependent methyltransferase [Candidatus Pacebacteria bacterium]|nr:class I SAM-dependent methyltransferase [Candidatus Paceibacterota bacterium]
MEPTNTPLEGFLDPDAVVGEFGILPGMRIADFGCGAGHIGIMVAQQVGKDGLVVAVDIMEDKLESIKARAKASGLENLEIKRANLEVPNNTGLGDSTQDLVLLINILFQSNKKSDIIKEAKRVLKTGSQVVVVDWKKGGGGFGPPNNLRTEVVDMQNLFTNEGLSLVRQFNAGQFHYGLIFKK